MKNIQQYLTELSHISNSSKEDKHSPKTEGETDHTKKKDKLEDKLGECVHATNYHRVSLDL